MPNEGGQGVGGAPGPGCSKSSRRRDIMRRLVIAVLMALLMAAFGSAALAGDVLPGGSIYKLAGDVLPGG